MDSSIFRFSVADIPRLTRNLTDIQKTLLDKVWDAYVSTGTPFPLRSLPSIVGRKSMDEIFLGLNGGLIYEIVEQDSRCFKLTIFGALLTGQGPVLARYLTKLLVLVKNLYENNHAIKEINSHVIKEKLSLSETNSRVLFRLLSLGLPGNMPFHLSGYSPDGSSWGIVVTDEVLDLHRADDDAAYLDSLLAEGYRPDEPYSYSERLKYQPPVLSEFAQEIDRERSGSFKSAERPKVRTRKSSEESTDSQINPQALDNEDNTPGKKKAKSTVRPKAYRTSLGLLNKLTQREYDIAVRVGNGESSKQIADACGITERTVKAYLTEVFLKLGVTDRLNLARVLSADDHSSSAIASASSALFSNRTEAEAVSDCLGREKLTTALLRILTEREDDHAFAIGLFGHWGSGKTSQVNFLQEELKNTEKPTVLIAKFDAWQNEKAANLAAMMAQSVVDGLVADKGIWEKLKLAVKLSALRHAHTKKDIRKDWHSFTVWLSWSWMLLPPVGSLLLLVITLWWVPLPDNLGTTFIKGLAIPAALVSAYYSVSHFMRSHLTEWFKKIDAKKALSLFALPDYSSHRGLILDIHHTLRNLCSLCLKGKSPKEGQYLLLVVDDLDRCGVDTVKDVLDAIRLVANIPRVVTLVAIDDRMAFAAVEKHYIQFGHMERSPAQVARDYLAKVLQVSVTLPEVGLVGISSYVDRKIFADIDQHTAAPIGNSIGVTSAKPPGNEKNGLSLPAQPIIGQQANSTNADSLPNTLAPLPKHTHDAVTAQLSNKHSSLPEEKELFKELAQIYNFSNPRLLWRHYMAWKLLKSLLLGPTYNLEEIEIPMQLMFWREWLHQLTTEKRQTYSDWMNAKGQGKPTGMPNRIFDAVKLKLRPQWDEYLNLIHVIDAVLLPTNHRGQHQNSSGNKLE